MLLKDDLWPLPAFVPQGLLPASAGPGRASTCTDPEPELSCNWTGCALDLGLGRCTDDNFPRSRTTQIAGAGEGVIFHMSDHLMVLSTTPSQVVQRPRCRWLSALTLYCSSSLLTTSSITGSFLSFLVAFDQNLGAVPHPKPALPDCVLPAIYLCVSLLMAWSTASSAFDLRPVRTGGLFFTGQSSFSALTRASPSPVCSPG